MSLDQLKGALLLGGPSTQLYIVKDLQEDSRTKIRASSDSLNSIRRRLVPQSKTQKAVICTLERSGKVAVVAGPAAFSIAEGLRFRRCDLRNLLHMRSQGSDIARRQSRKRSSIHLRLCKSCRLKCPCLHVISKIQG